MWLSNDSIINTLGRESNCIYSIDDVWSDLTNNDGVSQNNRGADEKVIRLVSSPNLFQAPKFSIPVIEGNIEDATKNVPASKKTRKRKSEQLESSRQSLAGQTNFVEMQTISSLALQSKNMLPKSSQSETSQHPKKVGQRSVGSRFYDRAKKLYGNGNYEEALKNINVSLDLQVRKYVATELYVLEGDIHRETGDFDAAERSYEHALANIAASTLKKLDETIATATALSHIFSIKSKTLFVDKKLKKYEFRNEKVLHTAYKKICSAKSFPNELVLDKELMFLHLAAAEYFLASENRDDARNSCCFLEEKLHQLGPEFLNPELHHRVELLKLKLDSGSHSLTSEQHYLLALDYYGRGENEQVRSQLELGVNKLTDGIEPLAVSQLLLLQGIFHEGMQEYDQAAISYKSLLSYLKTKDTFQQRLAFEHQAIWKWLYISAERQNFIPKDLFYKLPGDYDEVINIYRSSVSEGNDVQWDPSYLLRAHLYAAKLLISVDRTDEAQEVIKSLNTLSATHNFDSNSQLKGEIEMLNNLLPSTYEAPDESGSFLDDVWFSGLASSLFDGTTASFE